MPVNCLPIGGDGGILAEGSCSHFLVKDERTDSGVGAYVGTLVTLDTVFFNPLGNECGDTALFVCGCALAPMCRR